MLIFCLIWASVAYRPVAYKKKWVYSFSSVSVAHVLGINPRKGDRKKWIRTFWYCPSISAPQRRVTCGQTNEFTRSWVGSNHQPFVYQPNALTNCATRAVYTWRNILIYCLNISRLTSKFVNPCKGDWKKSEFGPSDNVPLSLPPKDEWLEEGWTSSHAPGWARTTNLSCISRTR